MPDNDPFSLSTIPLLVDNDSFPAWHNRVRLYLRSIGSLDVIEGTVVEPYRGATRLGRAGSEPPIAIGDDDGRMKKWQRWANKEGKVQAILLGTVDDGLKMRLEDLESAIEMWQYLEETHQVGTPAERARISVRLDSMALVNNPSNDEMKAHLREFNKVLYSAKVAGITYNEAEQLERFLITLPPSLQVMQIQFRYLTTENQNWNRFNKMWNDHMAYQSQWTARTTERASVMATIVDPRKGERQRDPKNGGWKVW